MARIVQLITSLTIDERFREMQSISGASKFEGFTLHDQEMMRLMRTNHAKK